MGIAPAGPSPRRATHPVREDLTLSPPGPRAQAMPPRTIPVPGIAENLVRCPSLLDRNFGASDRRVGEGVEAAEVFGDPFVAAERSLGRGREHAHDAGRFE